MKMNHNRGNESAEHATLKAEIHSDMRRGGAGMALCEELCTDVAVFRHGSMWGVEIECGKGQNSCSNALRDLTQGCDRVLFICKDKSVLGRVARRLAKLPEEFHARVAVMDITAWRVLNPKRKEQQ